MTKEEMGKMLKQQLLFYSTNQDIFNCNKFYYKKNDLVNMQLFKCTLKNS
jgi:hypothetical protein